MHQQVEMKRVTAREEREKEKDAEERMPSWRPHWVGAQEVLTGKPQVVAQHNGGGGCQGVPRCFMRCR